jgi:superfamily I DNA/RNA helicase
MLPEYIVENNHFFGLLARTKSERKLKKLLKNASPQQLLALAELCLNILTSRFQLTTRQKKRLHPYANYVRQMSRLKTEKGARRFIVQKGTGAGTGFFTALLTPLLIELVNRLTIKRDE